MISAAEEAIQPFVPDGERKIAQEKIRAVFAPLCISGQQELSIIGSRQRFRSESSNQIAAIMKLDVRCDGWQSSGAAHGESAVCARDGFGVSA